MGNNKQDKTGGRGDPGVVKPLSGYKTAERVERAEREVTPSAVFHPDGGSGSRSVRVSRI